MDLRAERTCEFLRNALLAYLDRQPLSSCTVKAVCERAGVSRKAFYAHYEALEDLAQDTYLCRCVYYGRHAKRLADYPSLEAACIEALDLVPLRRGCDGAPYRARVPADPAGLAF